MGGGGEGAGLMVRCRQPAMEESLTVFTPSLKSLVHPSLLVLSIKFLLSNSNLLSGVANNRNQVSVNKVSLQIVHAHINIIYTKNMIHTVPQTKLDLDAKMKPNQEI